MQPVHQTSDRTMAEARLGPARLAGAYAWATMLRNYVRLAFGTDFPVERPDPWAGWAAGLAVGWAVGWAAGWAAGLAAGRAVVTGLRAASAGVEGRTQRRSDQDSHCPCLLCQTTMD